MRLTPRPEGQENRVIADETPEIKAPPVVWEYEEDATPVLAANQFLLQHQKNEFFLTIGSLVLPPVLGTEEERARAVQRIPYIPIRVLGRYSFNRDRMLELINVLQTNLAHHDQRLQQLDGQKEEQ